MFSTQRKMIGLAVLCAALFIFGLTKLFLMRFEAGDVYPPYSSLRSDPLGTQALFESFGKTAAQGAQRNFRSLDQVMLTSGRTLLVCGLPSHQSVLNAKMWEKLLDRLAENGGRLVIAYRTPSALRASADRWGKDKGEDDNSKERFEKDCDGNQTEAEQGGNATQSLDETDEDAWQGLAALGLVLHRADEDKEAPHDSAVRMSETEAILPALIPWRSPLFFELEDQAWQTIYTWEDEPVVISRFWGTGTLVMVADSYLFSNEALRNNRLPKLLAWFAVPDHAVLFDEFHHGLVKQPGIAALMRKYRLHGVVATLVLLVVLFLWRQASVFVPAPSRSEEQSEKQSAVGRDTAEGLVNLMQQHIPPRDLLNVCFKAWHTSAATRRVPPKRVDQVKRLIKGFADNPRLHNPVRVYRQIYELLKQGKHR